MIDRRLFLGAVGAMVASAAIDPERLLWIPGRKLISIPAPMPPYSSWSEFITAYDFCLGVQWPPEVAHARALAGRPVLTVNRIYGIVQAEAARLNLPPFSEKWKVLVIDTYRKWKDTQCVLNLLTSNLAEVNALRMRY